MVEPVKRKFANAFIPDAQSRIPLRAVANIKRVLGGLWVGGTVELSQEGIRFEPNQTNAALHLETHSVWIPVADVRSVIREFGWVSGVVVVQHASGVFRFRCFGARRVAAEYAALLDRLDTESANSARRLAKLVDADGRSLRDRS